MKTLGKHSFAPVATLDTTHLAGDGAAHDAAEAAGGGRRRPAPSKTTDTSAEGDPAVLDREYWLRHCCDFLVDSWSGEALGVVDEVETDPESGRAVALVVSSGWFGRNRFIVAADEVEEIHPDERRLYVRRSTRSPSAERRRGERC